MTNAQLNDTSGSAAGETKPGGRGVRFWGVIVGVVGLVFVGGFWGGRELKWRFLVRCLTSENQNTRRAAFWKLMEHNGMEGVPWEQQPNEELREIIGTRASGRKMGNVYAAQVETGGDRDFIGYTFVFDRRGTCLLWIRDDHAFQPYCLADLTGDGAPELITLLHGGAGPNDGVHPGRLQVLEIGEAGRMLLDVRFNRSYLELDGWSGGGSVSLRKVKDLNTRLEFTWHSELGRFVATGEKSANWKMLVPRAEQ